MSNATLRPADFEIEVASEWYIRGPGTLTICVLTLRNGFQLVGESACVNPDIFDEETGRQLARANAKDKFWRLEGYRLISEQHAATQRQTTGEAERPFPAPAEPQAGTLPCARQAWFHETPCGS